MMKNVFLLVLTILFSCQSHSQPRVETYIWEMVEEKEPSEKIARVYENDSTFMEIGVFYESDTAWYEIRNGKWFMKNHEKDSFALFFDTSFVNVKTEAVWSYPITYNKESWSLVQGHCNEVRSYYWEKENRCYNGYPIYRVYYWDVSFYPPKEMYLKYENGAIKKYVWDSTRYIHPPVYYFFTYQLGIFGCYADLPMIRQGIDVTIP